MPALIEKLSRSVIVRRKLPARFGARPLYVSPGSALRYWGKLENVDPNLLANVDQLVRPGDVVWDIGANVGLFAFSAAAKAGAQGSVIAVEPDPWLSGMMLRSAAENVTAAAPVQIITAAVSDTVGVAGFQLASRGRASSHLAGFGRTQAGIDQRPLHSVLTVTLDWLLDHFPRPDLVKIDVEGAESLVLAGAERLLSEARPKLLCEVGDESAPTITALLKKHKYTLQNADAPTESRRLIDTAVWNTLATPAD